MNCLKCDREVVEQAKFCSYCGERLALPCTSCGVLNPPDGLFCHDCGRGLDESPAEPRGAAPGRFAQPQAVALKCPRCGAANEPGSTYCYQCGLPLEEELQAASGYAARVPMHTPYRSPRTLANWTVGLLVATCITYGLLMAMTFDLLRLVSQYEAGQFVSPLELADAGETVDAMSTLLIVLFIPTVALFLMWIHRASRNLKSLGAHGQRFSPGWAVGWWFVPIMFFFRPYQVMAEIWRGSHAAEFLAWRDGTVSTLLPWWWALWVAGNIIGFAVAFSNSLGTDAMLSSAALRWELLSHPLTIGAGVLAILVVRRITRRQDEESLKHRRMTTGWTTG